MNIYQLYFIKMNVITYTHAWYLLRENYKPMMVCVDWDGPQMQMGTDHQQLHDLHDDWKYLEMEDEWMHDWAEI